MSEIDDRERCGSDTNDLHQDRPTQVPLMDGSPDRQNRTKYTSSVPVGRFKGNCELSEDDDATLPKSRKTNRPKSPTVVQTNSPLTREDASPWQTTLTETIDYLGREVRPTSNRPNLKL